MPHHSRSFSLILPQGNGTEARLTLSLEQPAGEDSDGLAAILDTVCRFALATIGSVIDGPHCVELTSGQTERRELVIDGPNEWQGFEPPA